MPALMPREANDPHLAIRFFMKPVKDEEATRREKRPIFKDVEYIAVRWSSDQKRELEAPAHDAHRMRRGSLEDGGGWETWAESYPVQYEQFKAGKAQSLNGTPLSEAPFLTEARREELRALNILTVDALAKLDGTPLQRLGIDGRKMKDQAVAYLNAAASTALVESQSEEMEAMRQQIAELTAKLEGKAAPTAAGKGRGKSKTAESPEDAAARQSFASMTVEDLRAWLTDAGGDVSGKTKAELVNAAVTRNAEIRSERAAA